MHKQLKSLLLLTAFTVLCSMPVSAQEAQPDDRVSFTLSTEGWVTTKTARVMLGVEASVSGNAAGAMRTNMVKAVGDVVKTDWRLVSLNKSQDQTGMERWSAVYEARIAENELGGLHEAAKKVSKAGMQINVAGVDFSPTLEETQATMAQLRGEIYKKALEQLAALNSAIPGRKYRLADVEFAGTDGMMPAPPRMARQMMTMAAKAGGADMAEMADSSGSMERSEKLTATARVVMAAAPLKEPAAKAAE